MSDKTQDFLVQLYLLSSSILAHFDFLCCMNRKIHGPKYCIIHHSKHDDAEKLSRYHNHVVATSILRFIAFSSDQYARYYDRKGE